MDKAMSINEPSLYSTLNNVEPQELLNQPLFMLRDSDSTFVDYNSFCVLSREIIINYANFEVFYEPAGQGETLIYYMFNRVGEEFVSTFKNYFGETKAREIVKTARAAFEEFVREERPKVKICDTSMYKTCIRSSEKFSKEKLVFGVNNQQYLGEYEKEITADYIIENGVHCVQFEYDSLNLRGKVVSGYRKQDMKGLKGIIYTKSFIYEDLISENLGILFVDEDILVGFVWLYE